MATVKENLIAAKALIDTPEKWGRGDYENEAGCLCAYGAIMKAKYGFVLEYDDGPFSEDHALMHALPPLSGVKFDLADVSAFNDHPDTTHADIMALFDRAIAAEEAKEDRA